MLLYIAKEKFAGEEYIYFEIVTPDDKFNILNHWLDKCEVIPVDRWLDDDEIKGFLREYDHALNDAMHSSRPENIRPFSQGKFKLVTDFVLNHQEELYHVKEEKQICKR